MQRLHPGRALSIAATSAIVAFITFSSTHAVAQNAAAEVLFTDGERLLKEGKIAEACDAFDASNRLETRAGTLINLGLCREQNGQLASSWSAFKDALTRVKDPKKRQIAEDRVLAIEPKLSYLTISVSDESRIDGLVVTRNGQVVDPALWNRALPIDGGKFVVSGRAPGHEEWSTTVEVANESAKVSVEVPRFKELVKLVTPPPTNPEPAKVTGVAESQSPPGIFTPRRKIAVGVAAVGVVAIVGGVVFGTQANGFEDDAFALCPDMATPCPDGARANELIASGQTRAMLANVSFGVGAAAAIGGVVLWFLSPPTSSRRSDERVTIVPHAGATSAGLDLSVRF